jgi:hypothetical protein
MQVLCKSWKMLLQPSQSLQHCIHECQDSTTPPLLNASRNPRSLPCPLSLPCTLDGRWHGPFLKRAPLTETPHHQTPLCEHSHTTPLARPCPLPKVLSRPCTTDQQNIEHLVGIGSAFPLLADRPPQHSPPRHRPRPTALTRWRSPSWPSLLFPPGRARRAPQPDIEHHVSVVHRPSPK